MKKAFLTLSLIGAALCANAQVKQGTIMVGGEISIMTQGGDTKSGGTTVDAPSTFNLNIVPKIGYYMTDNLALGLEIGYLSSSQTTPANPATNAPEQKSSAGIFKVGPYVRYNMPFSDKFGFFLDGSANMGFGSSSVKAGGTTNDGPSIFALSIGVEPGFAYFVRNNIALEAKFGGLAYYMASAKTAANNNNPESTTTSNGFILGAGTGTTSANPAVNAIAGGAVIPAVVMPALSFGFTFYFGN